MTKYIQTNIILTRCLSQIRNKDLTWPEELALLSHPAQPDSQRKQATLSRVGSISREDGGFEKGCCGLNNLGNTCFMNAALQCLSYSRPLTYYFRMGTYAGELNRTNPVGYGGVIAERYAELVNQLWSGKVRTIPPQNLRRAICRFRNAFSGFQQHDSQVNKVVLLA